MNHSFKWQGRQDGEGDVHLRLHQVINTSPQQHLLLLLVLVQMKVLNATMDV